MAADEGGRNRGLESWAFAALFRIDDGRWVLRLKKFRAPITPALCLIDYNELFQGERVIQGVAMCEQRRQSPDADNAPQPPLPPTRSLSVTSPLVEIDSASGLAGIDAMPVPETVGTVTEYEIRVRLAVGGMGIVYWGWDQTLHRDVAIKLLRPEHRLNPELVERFVNESRVMGRLQHPAIPPVYDAGFCHDGRPYYAMKLVKGVTLSELATRTDRGKAGLLSVFAQVCQALDYAHSERVAHLDVKPNNIMVGAFGEVYLMDWGLARFRGSQPGASVHVNPADEMGAGSIRGTPAYMSPEQADGGPIDARSDIFGLGAVLCELLTGSPPYEAETAGGMLRQAAGGHTDDAFRRLDEASVDSRLVRLTKRCLAQSPDERPGTAGEVARDIQLYQETLLSRAEDDMQRFFELSLDLFCIAGLDGYFRRINSNFSRVLGFNEEDLLARPFVDFVHEEDRENTYRAMSVLARGEPVVRFRNRYQTAAGNYVTFEWTAKSFVGRELVFAVARDVTATLGISRR